jgi:hypothetical protein
VTYNVYFEIGSTVPTTATPYKSGITDTHFVIQASTDGRTQYEPDTSITPLHLEANTDYAWKICAADTQGHETCSPVRQFHTDNSVVGWWRFDEDPTGPDCPGGQGGETVCDYSGHGNHGLPMGGVSWIIPGMSDVLSGAFDLDGVDDSVLVPDDPSMDVGAAFSFSCRLNPNGPGATLNWDFPDSGPYRIDTAIPNLVECSFRVAGVWEFISGDYSGLVGGYFRTTCVYSGDQIELYVNQSLEGSKPISGTIQNNTNNLKFGFNENQNTYHDGIIDECLIFDKRISSEEALGLFGSDR